MTPESAIKKGKFLEKYVAEQIEQAGLGRARREVGSGSGKRKGDIDSCLEFLIEVKNQENPLWLRSIDQAKRQAEIGNFNSDKWMLVLRDPRSPQANPELYAVIDFNQILDLLKRAKEPKIKSPDREVAWKGRRAVEAVKAFLKEIEK